MTARAERPQVKVGDRWVFVCTHDRTKVDLIWVVTSVDESGIKGRENGKPLLLTPDLNVVERPGYSFSDARALSFPLEVGKRWEANDVWVNREFTAKGTEHLSVEVVSYEKVQVRAGEFDAFKLKWSSNWADFSGGLGTTDFQYWYAPAARAVVKSEMSRHWEPYNDCELTEFQLQP